MPGGLDEVDDVDADVWADLARSGNVISQHVSGKHGRYDAAVARRPCGATGRHSSEWRRT